VRLRTPVLAVLAVLVLAGAAAALTLDALNDRAPDSGGAASAEATRSLEAADATALPAFDTASPSGAIASGSPLPRQVTPIERRKFDVAAAMTHVRALEGFGVRAGGTTAEEQAASYIRGQLTAIGLDARVEVFPLSNGSASRNVIARVKGSSDVVLVLGAHYDSKPPSPGANDNASGTAALLEIAEIVAGDPVVPTVEFVFFGSEEIIGGDPNAHHFGSRYRVAQMAPAERARTAGMLSVDMIGYGTAFHARSMGKAPATLSDMLLAHAKRSGVGMTYLKDTSKSGLSDHEAYELAGIPAACVTWRTDPVYHSEADVASHLSTARIATSGALVLDFVRGLDAAELTELTTR